MMPVLELLVASYTLLRKHLWLYVGYAAWLTVPFAAFVILSFIPEHWTVILAGLFVSILELFLAIWISLMFIRFTAAIAQGLPIDPQAIQQESLKLIKASVRVMSLQLIIFLGGLILLVVPGLIFLVWYAFSQQSLVLDNKTDMQALEQSKQLVKGRFFPVLWRLVVGPVLLMVFYSLLVGSAITLVALLMGIDPATIYEADVAPVWTQMLEMAGEIFFFPIVAVYSTLLFLHLKKTYRAPLLEKEPPLA